jgi:CubicO group peptidase (beta-lactamase class C family)
LKKKFTEIIIFLTLMFTLLSCQTVFVGLPVEFDDFVLRIMRKSHVQGIALGVYRSGSLVWSGGYGWANRETELRASEDVLFQTASVSKTVTATAVMLLVEQGEISLDDPVGKYLDVNIRHPRYPETEITFRMLLAHASGIRDDLDLYLSFYTFGRGGIDSDISLEEFITGYLVEGGEWYDEKRNFHTFEPGKKEEYSNIGYALLGYLVEEISGVPFNKFCRHRIFMPLDMHETRWLLLEVDTNKLAMPYTYENRTLKSIGFYGFPTYPDGSLKTSVREYSHLLDMYMNSGVYDGKRLLGDATVEEMLRPQFPGRRQHGLCWHLDMLRITEKKFYGHTGGDPGVSTFVAFEPLEKTAYIIFCNGRPGLLKIIALVRRLQREDFSS